MRTYYVYMLSNPNRSLYVGVTNNLERRVYQHKSGRGSEHTERYKITELVYIEEFAHIGDAISREKELKGWRRSKKVPLIEQDNPGWLDLSASWFR